MTAVTTKAFPRRRNGFYHLDGEKYASVTEILSVIAKPALITWAAKTASSLILDDPEKYDTAEKAAAGIYSVRDKAADRGQTVHSWMEAATKGNIIDLTTVPDAFRGYAAAFLKFWGQLGPSFGVITTEANVYSESHGYAGTCDLIARWNGVVTMFDFKTSKDGALYPEVGLQLVAYKHAAFILTHDPIPTRMVMPAVEVTMAVGLAANGTFQTRLTDAPLEAFLAAKRLWTYIKGA